MKLLQFLTFSGMFILCLNPLEKAAAQNKPLPVTAWGSIRRLENFSTAPFGSRTVDVLLPENYPKDSSLRYPVLYMHDGQMLFDSSQTWNHQEWQMDEALRSFYQKNGKTCILVAIHNSGPGRYAEYFPQKPFLMLPEEGRKKVLDLAGKNPQRTLPDSLPVSDQYLKFLTGELKPAIDRMFRTMPDAEHTWLAGSSMGGLISLYALSEYPEVFGAAVCLSTHWPGIFTNSDNPVPDAFLSYFRKKFPRDTRHRLFLCTGHQGLDSLYRPHHRKAEQLFLKKIRRRNGFVSREINDAGHSERDWQKQMPEALIFLFKSLR